MADAAIVPFLFYPSNVKNKRTRIISQLSASAIFMIIIMLFEGNMVHRCLGNWSWALTFEANQRTTVHQCPCCGAAELIPHTCHCVLIKTDLPSHINSHSQTGCVLGSGMK